MKKGGNPQVTVFMDWSDDDLNKLEDTCMQYSGMVSLYDPIEVINNEYTLPREPVNFDGESLKKASRVDSSRFLSWATSVIEAAHSIIKEWFSIEQLINCVPQNEEIDGCECSHPKNLATYLMEVGLLKEGDFIDCNSVDPSKTYHFTPVYPESPNAGGLMNLVAEGKPVITVLALDLVKLRFVKEMSDEDDPYKCADYQPSMYGIISGYKYDENMIEDSYWEIVSHIVPKEEMKVRIPMSTNMTNGNYAGIAAYAFSLQLIGDMTEEPSSQPPTTTLPTTQSPTTQSPTTQSPTTQPPTSCETATDLIINSDSLCNQLFESGWRSITVNLGLCNSITSDLTIADNPCLESIHVYRDALKNVNTLVISNNNLLSSIITEDGVGGYSTGRSSNTGVFYYVNSVEITSILYMMM